MRKDQFEIHAALEDQHWWFRSRREILADQIAEYQPEARVVAEIGCGTGGNLRFLSHKGYEVVGTDIDPFAADLARERVAGAIYTGDYTETLKTYWSKIDVVILADVLEHIENDHQFLHDLVGNIHPGTVVVLTVPAMPILWSEHDVILGHCRRYTNARLRLVLDGLGDTTCEFKSYFNSLLLPVIFLYRIMGKALPRKQGASQSDLKLPSGPVNMLLRAIFSLERFWLGRKRTFPVGVSFLAILQKK